MRVLLVKALVLVAAAGAAQGQQLPEFEVVSIKPNVSSDTGGRNALEQNGYVGTNVTVRRIIALAWSPISNDHIVGGPGWLSTDRFDVRATSTGSVSRPQVQSMMRAMLAERFKLRTHMESRPTPVYALGVAREGILGPSLRRSTTECGPPSGAPQSGPQGAPSRPSCGVQFRDGLLQGRGVTLDRLAGELSAGRPVINRTGLAGAYDVDLRWTPDAAPAPADDAPPTLATALREQLGLKIESSTQSMEHLVIDSVDRPAPD